MNSRAMVAFLAGLFLTAGGCFGGTGAGTAGGAAEPPPPAKSADPAPPEVRRPAFLVYETAGKRVLVDDLGNRREAKLAQRISVCARALRTEDLGAAAATIIRLDRKVMWQLDGERRTWREATFGELAAQVEGVRKVLTLGLRDESLSAEKRRRLELAVGLRKPKVEVRADPQPVELLGHKCRHVSYYEDGELRVEEWAAEDLVSPCDLAEVQKLTGDFSAGLIEERRRRKGFALKTRVFGRLPTAPQAIETEVTRLETPEKLDPETFDIPKGYTQLKAPERREE